MKFIEKDKITLVFQKSEPKLDYKI